MEEAGGPRGGQASGPPRSPESVARQLLDLHAQVPFDVANVEVRWAGLAHDLVRDSLRRLMEEVVPRLEPNPPRDPLPSGA
jgi:hypothetical protein